MATVAPAAAFLVARSLTHTADLPTPSMENVAMSVTWSTAWRGTPAQVSVTRYQPAARRLGSWIQVHPSSTVLDPEACLDDAGQAGESGPAGVVETRAQSGAVSMACQASIAAARLGEAVDRDRDRGGRLRLLRRVDADADGGLLARGRLGEGALQADRDLGPGLGRGLEPDDQSSASDLAGAGQREPVGDGHRVDAALGQRLGGDEHEGATGGLEAARRWPA